MLNSTLILRTPTLSLSFDYTNSTRKSEQPKTANQAVTRHTTTSCVTSLIWPTISVSGPTERTAEALRRPPSPTQITWTICQLTSTRDCNQNRISLHVHESHSRNVLHGPVLSFHITTTNNNSKISFTVLLIVLKAPETLSNCTKTLVT